MTAPSTYSSAKVQVNATNFSFAFFHKEVFLFRELPLFRGLLRLHHGSESGRAWASLFYVKGVLSKLRRPLSKALLVPVYRKIDILSALTLAA